MKRTQKAPEPPSADIINKVIMADDLAKLTDEQRLEYYHDVCETLGLNPLTKPLDYLVLDGKLVLYARKDCTEQLRKRYGISLTIKSRERQGEVYVVVAEAKLPSGRTDESMGAVPLKVHRKNQVGEFDITAIGLANAVMRAETKAKRRVTLSICGMGILDESELDTVMTGGDLPDAAMIERNVREATANATGEEPPAPEITKDNWRDVECHIGKAQGNLFGRKLGEIDPAPLKWLAENWIPQLPAMPNDKDRRLRDAILFAVAEGKTQNDQPAAAPPPPPSRTALQDDLRGKIDDLILTPEQFMGYLVQVKAIEDNKTKAVRYEQKEAPPGAQPKKFEDLTDGQLELLVRDWELVKLVFNNLIKPNYDETIHKNKKQDARRRRTPKPKKQESDSPFNA